MLSTSCQNLTGHSLQQDKRGVLVSRQILHLLIAQEHGASSHIALLLVGPRILVGLHRCSPRPFLAAGRSSCLPGSLQMQRRGSRSWHGEALPQETAPQRYALSELLSPRWGRKEKSFLKFSMRKGVRREENQMSPGGLRKEKRRKSEKTGQMGFLWR